MLNEPPNYHYHNIIDDIVCAPGVLLPDGLNIYIIEKKVHLNSEQIDFVLLCKNIENIIYYQDPLRKNIILFKEDNNYYPIVDVYKETSDKNIRLVSLYSLAQDKIIPHLAKYMELSCENVTWTSSKLSNAKNF